jgi:zinc protease
VKKTLWCLLLLAVVAIAHAAGPQLVTLDNGLRLVVEEDHSAPVATVHLFVGTGSALEDTYLGDGISHFLEHVLGEGSQTRTREQIERDETLLGNVANAYTTHAVVGYFVVTSGGQTLQAVDHIADYVLHPIFPETEVETQRGIILREMAMGEDDPSRELWNLFARTVFHISPEGVPTIGYVDQFKAVTRDDLVALHRRFYVPANIVAVAVGDFRAEEVIARMREVLGKLPPRAYHAPVLPAEPPQLAPRRLERHDARYTRGYLMLGYPTVSLYSPDMYPLDVASYILSNGAASRLVAKLRDDQGLVDSIGSYSSTPTYGAGIFGVSATADPEKLPAVEQAVLAELQRLQREPVAQAELDRAKRQKEADLLFSRVSTQGRASSYGSDLITTGDLHFSDRYVAGIRTVTAKDIQRAARQYFVPERYNFVSLSPPPTRAAATKPETTGPTAAAAAITETKLGNGLRLLVQENHAVPVVNLFLCVPGGSRYETADNVGLTSLMAGMLPRGTRTRTRLQIARALEDVGGALSPYSGRNSFGVTAQVRSQDLPLAIQVAADVLLNPTFPEAEFAQARQLQLAALQARADDVNTVANDALLQALFLQYPYRFPTAGTTESVTKLTRADLAAFHARMVKPAGMVLAIFGDTTPAAAQALAEKAFGGLPAGAAPESPAVAEAPPTESRVKTITRPQQQAIITYAFRAGIVDSPDRYVQDVMNAVFAGLGYPGGRLHAALRGQQLVYATYAYGSAGPQVGYFTIYAGTAPDQVGVVQEQIEQIIRDLQAAPPTDDELALAKTVAIANHAVGLESSGDRAQAVALDVLYGLGSGEIFRYAGEINQVTAAQVQEQARKIMALDRKVLVITTPEK